MDEPSQDKKPDPRPERLSDTVGRDVDRKLRARRESRHTAWFGMGMFGLVGWSVAVPTLIGTALGLWLDENWPTRHSWTLTFLIIGMALGCLNAWYWVKQESGHG